MRITQHDGVLLEREHQRVGDGLVFDEQQQARLGRPRVRRRIPRRAAFARQPCHAARDSPGKQLGLPRSVFIGRYRALR